MSEEYHDLTQLIEAMSLTNDARKKLETAQNELTNAETDVKATALEKVNQCTQELATAQDKENSLRRKARTHLITETESKKEESVPSSSNEKKPDTIPRHSAKQPMSFKLPQLEKFKRGENFSKYCEKFLEYVTLGNISGDNLPLIFFQLVDDFTRERLKKITLSPGQRRDAKQFIEEYIKKMCPPHEGSTFKARLADMIQKPSGETVEEYAYRISDTASRAYTDSESALKEEACFSVFMKGLTDSELRIKLHENTNIKTFEQALDEATRLETIKATIGPKSTTPSATEDLEILRINEDEEDHETSPMVNRESHATRPRTGQNDHRQAPTNPSHSRTNYQTRNDRRGRNQRSPGHADRHNLTYPTQQSSDRRNGDNQARRGRRNGPIICYNCQQPNHMARNCTASLNY